MKAMILNSFGGPATLRLTECAKSLFRSRDKSWCAYTPRRSTRWISQVRRGDYRDWRPGSQPSPVMTSGVVEAVGPGVTSFSPGDEVWYTPQIFDGPGSYAEYHVANESIIGRKPPRRAIFEAASLSLVGGTAWEALAGRAALRVGRAS